MQFFPYLTYNIGFYIANIRIYQLKEKLKLTYFLIASKIFVI